ncbi:hypothetical protein [Amycolatopsis sp. NPDC051372]|uniref:hypothetical protein n=1 Tax=Amycolatopsis sp. NPDC051372 TaxID=3155669 RepID=UPI0034439E2F
MTESFTVGIGTSVVEGDLTVPGDAAAVVAFAHGSGSSRHSPRNQAVAQMLQDHRFATLLLDMLSQEADRAEAAGVRHQAIAESVVAGAGRSAVGGDAAVEQCINGEAAELAGGAEDRDGHRNLSSSRRDRSQLLIAGARPM